MPIEKIVVVMTIGFHYMLKDQRRILALGVVYSISIWVKR